MPTQRLNTLALAGGFVATVPPGKYKYVLSIKQGIPTADSLEKTLMLGKIQAKGEDGSRGRDGWMASPVQWT